MEKHENMSIYDRPTGCAVTEAQMRALHGFWAHPRTGYRNSGRANAMFLRNPIGYLAHCAHYIDALPAGKSLRDYNVQNYLAAADAVGAWG